MFSRPERLSKETIDDNGWWKYKHEKFETESGEQGDYYYGQTDGAVMIVPILPNEKLGLVMQYRYISDCRSIEFPGGAVESELGVEDSARAELREETGFIPSDMTKIGTFQPDSGMVDDLTHVFIAQIAEIREQKLEGNEQIEVKQRRVDEFQDMVTRGEISSGQTLAVWSLVSPYLYNLDPSENEMSSPGVKKILDKFFS